MILSPMPRTTLAFFALLLCVFHTTSASRDTDSFRSPSSRQRFQRGTASKRSRDELENDIHLSFHTALKLSFAKEDTLTSDRQAILLRFLDLLGKTLPSAWSNLHALTQTLRFNVTRYAESPGQLQQLLDLHPPTMSTYSAVCGGNDGNKSYRCGMWVLFHAITVGVVEHNQRSVEQLQERDVLATAVVAEQISGFAQSFYLYSCNGLNSCEPSEFAQLLDSHACVFDRCTPLQRQPSISYNDWIQLAVWFVNVHNHLDLLAHQSLHAEDRFNPNSRVSFEDWALSHQWPTTNDCPACRQGITEGKKWNDPMLFKYLELQYGSEEQGKLIESSLLRRKKLHQDEIVQTLDSQENSTPRYSHRPPPLHHKAHSGVFFSSGLILPSSLFVVILSGAYFGPSKPRRMKVC